MSRSASNVKKALVGGGTGFIGQQLAPLLVASGYTVKNVSRRPAPENISWQQVRDSGIPRETKAVVNLAGHNIMDLTERWSPSFKESIEVSRVNTTRMLATAINKSQDKPRAFVLVTGVGAYEPSETAEYDEKSPISNTDFFSKLVAKWEDAAKVDPPVRLVIIRSGAVLGRTGGMIKSMYLPFWLGLGGNIGSGKQYLPWIHVSDLTRLIMHALNNDNVTGVLNGVAPQVITNKDFTQAFAGAMRRPACLPGPEPVLNLLLNPERAMIMTRGQKVHPNRTLASGFQYDFPDIKTACEDLVRSAPKENKFPLK